MSMELDIVYLWVPRDLGGHRAEPYTGMRLTLRWQRYIEEFLHRARDVECSQLTFEPSSGRGAATLRFVSDDPVPEEWTRVGELIELLNGHRVLALGKIERFRPG